MKLYGRLRNTKREATIIKIWLENPNMSYASLARIFHVSRQRIHQIILRYLKKSILKEGVKPSQS